jgi:polyphosphate kinase
MGRNMFGRIELAWPVREPKVRQRVIDECLVPYLHDHCDAWTLDSQGVYHRDGSDGPGAQAALMAKYAPDS